MDAPQDQATTIIENHAFIYHGAPYYNIDWPFVLVRVFEETASITISLV